MMYKIAILSTKLFGTKTGKLLTLLTPRKMRYLNYWHLRGFRHILCKGFSISNYYRVLLHVYFFLSELFQDLSQMHETWLTEGMSCLFKKKKVKIQIVFTALLKLFPQGVYIDTVSHLKMNKNIYWLYNQIVSPLNFLLKCLYQARKVSVFVCFFEGWFGIQIRYIIKFRISFFSWCHKMIGYTLNKIKWLGILSIR